MHFPQVLFALISFASAVHEHMDCRNDIVHGGGCQRSEGHCSYRNLLWGASATYGEDQSRPSHAESHEDRSSPLRAAAEA